ncbi:WXG100 family type VII secretion target [Nocardia australiensis]|uniref:WXG100 family type VII secretion target n=1 Tax=Nocardia australiensis TaxID=2887191 RepID=UPI001D144D96|nr:WXG100 family type VII secretion target [Nocardia australiensis]
MSDGVYADHATAKGAQGDMADAVAAMKWTIQQISDEVHSASGWSGDARGAFMEATAAWDTEATELNRKLDAISQQVGTGTVDFQRTDTEGEDEFKMIRL